jgi:hypothetical protein
VKNAIEFQGHRVIFRHGSHIPLYLDGNECFELPPASPVSVCGWHLRDSSEAKWLELHGHKISHSICPRCALEFGVEAGENKP